MTVNKTQNANELLISIEGRLDTTTAPEFEKELGSLEGISCLIIDLKNLEYISSAGLRVLLSAHKKVSANGKMVVRNVNEVVSEVFEVTGFKDILHIE